MALGHHNAYWENGDCYSLEPKPHHPLGVLKLLHPGYPCPIAGGRIIVPFATLDCVPGSNPAWYGVHYGTLMWICYIITGNRLGFLSPTKLPGAKVPSATPEEYNRGFDDVLTEQSYYYYIYGTPVDEAYRILDDFDSWSFPIGPALTDHPLWTNWENAFPTAPSWEGGGNSTDISGLVKLRDIVCQLTGVKGWLGCQAAHIIPASKVDWFHKNNLMTFGHDLGSRTNITTRPSNMFLLRSDIHIMFDAKLFTFVPKEGNLMGHFFDKKSAPACFDLHNAIFRHPEYLSAHFFLARLAWTVLPMMDQFTASLSLDQKPKKRARDTADEPSSRQHKSKGTDPGQQGDNLGPQNSAPGSGGGNINVAAGNNCGNDRAMDETIYEDITEIEEGDHSIDEEELARDYERAHLCYPDIFPPSLSRGGSVADSTVLSPGPSFAHLSPDRAQKARHDVNTLTWYPGVKRIQRLEEAYLKANPQVRERVSAGIVTMEEVLFERSPEL
ncbi:hypothetical protein BDV93DRAFT_561743 [Ceratobasidium sp. AG-I]|nr:hypothetical protein BDV93DRAFT_561743 [Ceratobasidium sp. AG-I]